MFRLHTVGAGGAPVEPSTVTTTKVRRSLVAIVGHTRLCALATVAPGSRAHGAHVYFAHSPRFDIYFLSDPDSNHCRHLKRNPSMSVSVYDSTQHWGGPDRGVTFYGRCAEARGRSRSLAERYYSDRFVAYRRWREGVRPGDETARWRFYRFVPIRFKVFDEHSLGSGVFVVGSFRG